jgi:acyl-CoA dehydrogenase
MAVTELSTGTYTKSAKQWQSAGDCYVVNDQKVWISRIKHSALMILLARTLQLAEVKIHITRHVSVSR